MLNSHTTGEKKMSFRWGKIIENFVLWEARENDFFFERPTVKCEKYNFHLQSILHTSMNDIKLFMHDNCITITQIWIHETVINSKWKKFLTFSHHHHHLMLIDSLNGIIAKLNDSQRLKSSWDDDQSLYYS